MRTSVNPSKLNLPFIQIPHFQNTNNFLDYIISDPIHVSFYTKEEKRFRNAYIRRKCEFRGWNWFPVVPPLFESRAIGGLKPDQTLRYPRRSLQPIYSMDWHSGINCNVHDSSFFFSSWSNVAYGCVQFRQFLRGHSTKTRIFPSRKK